MRVEMNSERIRELREEKGMRQRDLAAAAGVNVATARRAERGEPVQADTARSVARALGVDPPQKLGRVVR